MSDNNKPGPCPVCRTSKNVDVYLDDYWNTWYVSCVGCGLHGPFALDDKQKAISGWNERYKVAGD